MKKIQFVLILCLSLGQLNAQVIDDFEDNDLNAAPQWWVQSANFLNTNGVLKSNSNTANSSFGIACNFNLTGELQWQINVKLAFNTSSLNYIDFFLFADSVNIHKSRNGYFVRMGGSSDEISLFSLSNGQELKVIDGKDGLLNVSSSQYLLTISLKNDTFILSHTKQGSNTAVVEGQFFYANQKFEPYTGIRVRQSTSSFFYKHQFDQLYIGPLLKDTLPPHCDSFQFLNSRTVLLFMNENCDSLSMSNKANYTFVQGNKIDSVRCVSGSRLLLFLKDTLVYNSTYQLTIDGVKDLSTNKMRQSIQLIKYKTDLPNHWEVLFSELMIDPDPVQGLPNEEYVEIFNASQKFIQLSQLKISDPGSEFVLPSFVLYPDSFFILYKIPSLNNSADHIQLKTYNGLLVDDISYTDTWYADDLKKQGGYSLERIDLSQPCLASCNWAASQSLLGGTPNQVNSVSKHLPPDTIAPQFLGFETSKSRILHLKFNEAIDSNANLEFRINGQLYALKFLSSIAATYLFEWPWSPSTDSQYFVTLKGVRDCQLNANRGIEFQIQWPAIPLPGELLINEVLFNPVSNGSDFVELYNTSGHSFNLAHLYFLEYNAQGQIQKYYPLSAQFKLLKPKTFVLITEDTAQVCTQYNCHSENGIKLQSRQLMSMPDAEGRVVLGNLLDQTIDSLYYRASWHFTFLEDQNGVSLERLSYSMPTNEPHNWHSAASSIGYASPANKNSQIMIDETTETYFTLNSRSLSPDMDGFEDLLIMRYHFPGPDYLSTIKIYNLEGREMKTIINHKTLGSEGAVVWDGSDQHDEVLPIGIYLVFIECISPEGKIHREKLSVLLAEHL